MGKNVFKAHYVRINFAKKLAFWIENILRY